MVRPTMVYIDADKLLCGIADSAAAHTACRMRISNWDRHRLDKYGGAIDFPAFVGRAISKTEAQKCAAALREFERQGLVEVWDSIRAMRVRLTEAGQARVNEIKARV